LIYKRGKTYWYKFMWQGRMVYESTKQRNDKVARNMESAHRTSLAKGEVGIREKRVLILKDFLREDFLPFAQTKHAAKPLTLRYYRQGCDMLLKSSLAGLRLDEINDSQAQDFARKNTRLSAAGINRGLRTLRRALNLAYQWGKLDKPIKITLATGERMRERVLTEEESIRYLNACSQPWRDCATLILDEGFRPSEVFALRWTHILFSEDGAGLIQIVSGKSKAARRILPMTPRVFDLLRMRYETAGRPSDGWIFPRRRTPARHINGDGVKDQHKRALAKSGIEPFEFVPYSLRHTGLTKLGEAAGGNVFVLACIAGHSSIATTQRYVHPQAEAINDVFGASQKRLTGDKPRDTQEIASLNAPSSGSVSSGVIA
jgi:integrase